MSNQNSLPALYIGRFQPFHNGHLDAVTQVLAQHQKVIIGIGSAEDNFLPQNPFTAGERISMIDSALLEASIDPARFQIIPIRNINNYALWVSHVELYCPQFGVVYTGSEIVSELFSKHGQHPVKQIEKKIAVSATIVRDKILNDQSWQELLPSAVVQQIEGINGVKRIQKIQSA